MPTHENYIRQFIVPWKEPFQVQSIEHEDSNGGVTARVVTDKELNGPAVPAPPDLHKEYVQHESGVTFVIIKEHK